jgi:hypothetical protein
VGGGRSPGNHAHCHGGRHAQVALGRPSISLDPISLDPFSIDPFSIAGPIHGEFPATSRNSAWCRED